MKIVSSVVHSFKRQFYLYFFSSKLRFYNRKCSNAILGDLRRAACHFQNSYGYGWYPLLFSFTTKDI